MTCLSFNTLRTATAVPNIVDKKTLYAGYRMDSCQTPSKRGTDAWTPGIAFGAF